MGGVVAVTVRFSEDEQYRMTWGTSGLGLFRASGFVQQDAAHLAECRKRWAKPELAGMLAPDDYGLVVVDFVTKRIISFQNFTSLDTSHLIKSRGDQELFLELKQLATAGFITKVVCFKDEGKGKELTKLVAPLTDYAANPEEAVAEVQRLYDEDFDSRCSERTDEHAPMPVPNSLVLETPFAVTHDGTYPADMDWVWYRKTLVEEMGFTLTEAEEKAWADWIQDMSETAACV